MGGGPGKEVAFTPWFQIFGNIFIDIIPKLCRRSSYFTIFTFVNLIDKPNFRPKTDTRSPRNKFRFQTWVSVGAISVILWTSNLSGFENYKTCVYSFDWFGFYWLNTDAFGVCCRLEDAIIVDAAAAFSVTTAQISQLRKFNMINSTVLSVAGVTVFCLVASWLQERISSLAD